MAAFIYPSDLRQSYLRYFELMLVQDVGEILTFEQYAEQFKVRSGIEVREGRSGASDPAFHPDRQYRG